MPSRNDTSPEAIRAAIRNERPARKPPTNDIRPSDHLKLVWMVVNWMAWDRDNKDELFGAGCLGLLHATKWYENRGGQFSSYAVECIKGTILRWRENETRFRYRRWREKSTGHPRSRRVHLFSELGELFTRGTANEFARTPGNDPWDDLDRDEYGFNRQWQGWLKKLQPREQEVIQLRFGIDSKTLDEIATLFGITRERIRQIQTRALFKLRNITRGLPPYAT